MYVGGSFFTLSGELAAAVTAAVGGVCIIASVVLMSPGYNKSYILLATNKFIVPVVQTTSLKKETEKVISKFLN